MKPLNKQLWYRALDKAVPETYTTLSGEQLGRAIDVYTELVVRECIDKISDCSMEYCTRPQIVSEIKEHFGVE